jgi:hypothetical protein
MPKLTKRTVDAAAPRAGRYYVWDTEIKGFGLLVLPSGVKTYFLRYRTPEGTRPQPTIGKHGDYTPDQARERADQWRQLVKAGHDPLGEKRARLQAPTVTDLLNAYVASERFASKAPSTQAIDRGRIERHLKPTLGRKHTDVLTPGDVERAFAAIRDGKTATDVRTRKRGRARVTGGEGTARMAIELLRAAFTWAVRDGVAKTNPCEQIKTGVSGTRDAILEEAADYARLFETLGDDGARKAHPCAGRGCDPSHCPYGRAPRRNRRATVGTRGS